MGDVKCLLWVRRSGGLPLGTIIVEVTVGGRGGAGERRDRGYEGAAWTPSAEFRAEGFRFKDVFSLGTVLSKDLVSMDHQGVLFTPTLIRIRVLFFPSFGSAKMQEFLHGK